MYVSFKSTWVFKKIGDIRVSSVNLEIRSQPFSHFIKTPVELGTLTDALIRLNAEATIF